MRTTQTSKLSGRLVALGFATTLLAAAGAAAALEDSPFKPEPTAQEAEAQRLADFKLAPIASLAAPGRELRRVTFADIYESPGLPAVMFEKLKTGEVEMTVTSFTGKVVDKAILKPEAWAYLTANEAKALSPPKATKTAAEFCVGDTSVIEAIQNGKVVRREAAVCAGAPDVAAMEYTRTLAFVAATSIPRCAGHVESARDPSWYLKDCARRALVPEFKSNNYSSASGDNHDKFVSFAVKTWNNLDENLKKQVIAEATQFDHF